MPEAGCFGSMQRYFLCRSEALSERGAAVDFEVMYESQPQSAFAVRFDGQVHAYLNRCNHVPMELDFQRNQFFDSDGELLICATHGAVYAPDSGQCLGGPCRGGLVKIDVSETDGQVYWHTSALVQFLKSRP